MVKNKFEIMKMQNENLELFKNTFLYSEKGCSLEGKRILDIGCGNTESGSGDGWAPENARRLVSLGANVIGIDIGGCWSEAYTHIKANLVNRSLKEIVPEEFKPDIVLAIAFFDSPTLIYNMRTDSKQFPERVCREIFNILDDSGVFFIDSFGLCSFRGINDGRSFLEDVGFRFIEDFNSVEAYGKRFRDE